MEDLKDVYLTPLPDSPYVRPFRFNYTQGGKEKNWDMLEVHDSVAIIVFNVTRNVLIFVKQFRPAIYYNSIPLIDRQSNVIDTSKYPAQLGITLEMCAGIVDKNKSLQEIAKEEVLEECGYDVPVTDLHKIASYRAGVGVQGALQTMFYCEVTDDMKVGTGGGVEDEIIEVVEKSIGEVEKWIYGPGPLNSPPSCLFALMWFLRNKGDKYRKSFEWYCGECKVVENDTFFVRCGGVEDEIIEVVEKSIGEVEKWIYGPGPLNSPPSCLFALMWFLRNKGDKYRKPLHACNALRDVTPQATLRVSVNEPFE